MREIKFRAIKRKYGTEIGKMVYGTGIFKDGINVWLYSHDETKPMAFQMGSYIVDEETIGQYTGLKDRNGKEIYEGDILEQNHTSTYHIGEVKFLEEVGAFILYSDDMFYTFDGTNPKNYEVIRNIYENKDLIE